MPFSPKQFAAADSPFPARRIPLSQVKLSQHEAVMDRAKIDRMKSTWSDGFAPPVVAERNGQYFVLDGHHRAMAAAELGKKTLRVRISE
ncbi:MAG TPA: ParB N-terminal domain-containing protein [Gemmatimonadales bacterium]|nr:ParB N-terminal domain-containing protein [Gemmatimonadales bacterium]